MSKVTDKPSPWQAFVAKTKQEWPELNVAAFTNVERVAPIMKLALTLNSVECFAVHSVVDYDPKDIRGYGYVHVITDDYLEANRLAGVIFLRYLSNQTSKDVVDKFAAKVSIQHFEVKDEDRLRPAISFQIEAIGGGIADEIVKLTAAVEAVTGVKVTEFVVKRKLSE